MRKLKWILLIILVFGFSAGVAYATSASDIILRLCDAPYPKEQREKYADACWFCKPLGSILSTMLECITSAFSRTQKSSIRLLGIGFGLWLLWMTMLSIFDPKGGSKYIKQIGMQMFRVIFAVALLQMSFSAINLILGPPTDVMFSYGLSIAKAGSSSSISTTVASNDILSLFQFMNSETGEVNKDGLLGQLLMPLNNKIMMTLADGTTLFRYSFQRGPSCMMPSLELLAASIMIMVFSIILIAIFPLKIIDAVFRLGFVIVLMPLLIVAWAFPITRTYAKKGFDIFFGALVFFMTLCITTTISLKMIDIAIEPYTRSGFGFETKSWDQWAGLFHTAAVEFFILMGTYLLAIKLVSSTQSLSQELGGNIGSGSIGKGAVMGTAGAAAMVGGKVYRTGRGAQKWAKNKIGMAKKGAGSDNPGDVGPDSPPPSGGADVTDDFSVEDIPPEEWG